MASILSKLSKRAKEETPFMTNGRMLLEELISSCDGKCNPIRTFSAKELQKATNNYDAGQRIVRDCDYILYKGFLEEEDRPISVKKYVLQGTLEFVGSPFTDVVVGSQMSVHKNALQLIGCCLETEHPILVYEFVGSKTLSKYLYHHTNEMQPQSLSWNCRLKVAVDVANALAYLHTALSRPVINRDIKSRKILLDENYVAKLMDFSLSIAIPDGETDVRDRVVGTYGFAAPDSVTTGSFTEKSDVYSFGIVLLRLFLGQEECNPSCYVPGDHIGLVTNFKSYIARNGIDEIFDPAIMAKGPLPGKKQQLNAFIALALRCTHENAKNRPTMIEVGKELRQIHHM